MQVKIEISNRHCHLSAESIAVLFGGKELTVKKMLLGEEFASNELVTLKGPKGTIEKVRVLGPARKYDQVELLTADQFKLGVEAPMRMSGDLKEAGEITIIGPCGELTLNAAIIAARHIHISRKDLEASGYSLQDEVTVKVDGPRGGIMEHVKFKIFETEHPIMHIDQEEGNAFGIKVTQDGLVLGKCEPFAK